MEEREKIIRLWFDMWLQHYGIIKKRIVKIIINYLMKKLRIF